MTSRLPSNCVVKRKLIKYNFKNTVMSHFCRNGDAQNFNEIYLLNAISLLCVHTEPVCHVACT